MALLHISLGRLSWICEGKFDMGSPCIQRATIDVINLVFLGVFYLFLLLGYITKKYHVTGRNRRDRISVIVSTFCALISIAHISIGLRDLIAENNKFSQLSWLVYIARGLVWLSLTVSLLVKKTKWTRILVILWWGSFSVLFSALNIEMLVQTHNIEVLDMVDWPVSLLLLVCVFRNLSCFATVQRADTSLSDPRLGETDDKSQSNTGEASFTSKLTFSWIIPLLRLGYKRPLGLEDIPPLGPEDKASINFQKFSLAWDSLVRGSNSKTSRNLALGAITKVHLKENIFVGICALLRTIAVVVLPLFLYAFVNYSNLKEQNHYQGLSLVGGLILLKGIESLSQRHCFFLARQSGMRMRSALMVAVYQKQLKLSNLGRRNHSTGEIVNYIAVDAYRMGEFPWWFHMTWSLTLQLLLSVVLLFGVVGLGAVTGLVPLLICGILNIPFARMIQNFQSQFMIAQDSRLRATSEILNNMKVVKLQSWEEKFKNLIDTRRDTEFQLLAKMQLKKAYGTFLYWMTPTIISSAIFLGCAIFGSSPLNASTIFTVLATLRSMGDPVSMIPEALSVMIQVMVSFDRINKFLIDDELKNESITGNLSQSSDTSVTIEINKFLIDDELKNESITGNLSQSSDTSVTIEINKFLIDDELKNESITGNLSQCSDTSVTIEDGIFSWDLESTFPTLRDVNLDVKWGQKIAVCGSVGAGKSSLLHAVLGEMPKLSGNVNVSGSIAYVSQTSWIQSGTVRDNILYGKPMDNNKYLKAIKACALDKDIDSFRHGDLTEIGQRGLNMSGGQKQRIQLARAIYRDADIYLLDDPFSAVDAHTGAVLFNDYVMTALGKKIVLLVTHQVEFLSAVDRILVMEGGLITQSGNYKELLTVGTAFEQLVNAHKDAITVLAPINNKNKEDHRRMGKVQSEDSNGCNCNKESSEGEISIKGMPGAQLTEEEEREVGDVGWKSFLDYLIVSKGMLFFCLCVLGQCGFVSLQAAASYWLAFAIQIPKIRISVLIGIYALISMLSVVCVCWRSIFTAHLGLKASKTFFSGFNNSIFKAPMHFFDSTPVGRILTRASSDMSIIDFDIPFASIFVIGSCIQLVATLGIMASITWQVLLVAVLTMVASNFVQGYYLASARELMRINGTTKAPLMNYTSETALGVVTIRAFRMEDTFIQNFVEIVDKDAALFFHSNGAMEWLVLSIEALQNVTLFAAAFLLVLLPRGYVPPGLVGLSLSYMLPLTGIQVFITRWYCNLSNYMVSVERIKQFMHIPPEPPAVVLGKRPPSSWPSNGRIVLQDLKIRYRPNAPLVLKGITCTFKEGTRVGVVGRTGSGKTTLISALFRLVEPEGGKILIDGLDICAMGLKDLRMKLSIIPQEPTLFKGSVRTNLDPLGLYSDQEIWEALEKCQLKATISSLPNLLDSSVSDEGENWSAGQRQLFCLGRVLLKRNRILVLDEATASIDSATDAVLQRIIRQEFLKCTVITVAHRVPTVIDSDMVMVLSYGKMVEYDEPSKLMETNSSFSKLVAEYWASCRRNT